MHVGMQHKVLVRAGRHKARPPHPPLPLPWGRDKTVCLSACSQQEGAGAQDERLWRWWGGDSLAVFIYWLDVSVGGLEKGTVTSGILMLI